MFNQFVYGSLANGIYININIIVNPISRELDFFSETIDWEQRRYELAKEIVNVVIANDIGVCSDVAAKYSVNCANAIIKRLKEVNNE